jgi:hypothetical protein
MSDDYDPDAHGGYSFEDVCDRLDNIEAAVKDIHSGFSWVGLILVGWLIFAGIEDFWGSKLRYSLQYGVNYDQVTIEKKPADCNFFHVPLGGKGCNYDRQVNIVKVDNSNVWGGQSISYDNGENWIHTTKNKDGVLIASRDGGTTWSTDSVPPLIKPGIFVTWEKKEDDE